MSNPKLVSAENLAFFKKQCDSSYKKTEERVIVHRSIPLNARAGDIYFFGDHKIKFRLWDGEGKYRWECDVEHSYGKAVRIPDFWGNETVSNLYSEGDLESLYELLSENACIISDTNALKFNKTTSPYFEIITGRVYCVKPVIYTIEKKTGETLSQIISFDGNVEVKRYRSFPPCKVNHARRYRFGYYRIIHPETIENQRGILLYTPIVRGYKSIYSKRIFKFRCGLRKNSCYDRGVRYREI